MPPILELRGRNKSVNHPSVAKAVKRFRTLLDDESLLRQIVPLCSRDGQDRSAKCETEELEQIVDALNTKLHIHFTSPFTGNQLVPEDARFEQDEGGTYGWYYSSANIEDMDTTIWINSSYLFKEDPLPHIVDNIAHIIMVTLLHELCHFLVKRVGGSSPANPWSVGPKTESGEHFEVVTFGGRLGYSRFSTEPIFSVSSLYITAHDDGNNYVVPDSLYDQLWTAPAPVFPIPIKILKQVNTKLPKNPLQVCQRPEICLACNRVDAPRSSTPRSKDIVYESRPFGGGEEVYTV